MVETSQDIDHLDEKESKMIESSEDIKYPNEEDSYEGESDEGDEEGEMRASVPEYAIESSEEDYDEEDYDEEYYAEEDEMETMEGLTARVDSSQTPQNDESDEARCVMC